MLSSVDSCPPCIELVEVKTPAGLRSVTYAAPVGQDNCTGAVTTQVGGLASGVMYPVGRTTNTFEATDGAGNKAACSFVVAVDNCSGVTVTQSVAVVGTELALGTNEVVLALADEAGNVAYGTNYVILADTTPPVVLCPVDLSVTNDPGQCGAVVTYAAPVGQDNCAGAVTTQVGGLASGVMYPVGRTTNTFEVTDGVGNKAACSFVVTVVDTEPPLITWQVTNVVVSADTNCQGWVPDLTGTNYVVAMDNSGSVIITQSVAAGTVLELAEKLS